MWDEFAPRLRRVIVVALDDARDAAGVENLIRAVARDPQCAGARILKNCGLNLTSLAKGGGTGGKRADKLDESSLRILRNASEISRRLRHEHVGTEHLTLALAESAHLEVTPQQAMAAFNRSSPRRPLRKIRRLIHAVWSVYVHKSLGHPGYVSNPYPLYAWLRQRRPVRRDPLAPVWILTRYEDIAAFLRDPQLRKDPFGGERLPKQVRLQLDGDLPSRDDIETVSMLFLDPPEHTRVRALFSRAFTPASLTRLRGRIEEITRTLLNASGDQIDLMSAVASPLPVMVIAELLGFPPGDFQKIKNWSDDFAESLALNATAQQQLVAAESRRQIRAYFDEIVANLQSSPADNLLGRLIAAEGETDALDREEIFSNSVLLLAAGHETTTHLIGNGILALMRNRDQWNLLVADPPLIPDAVEEMLRFDCPVQWTSRLTAEPTRIGDQTVPAGEVILGCLGAANRDPAKFPEPNKFDIHRSENRHIAFGIGPHFCLGAALARMEAQIVLAELVRRFPAMRLGPGKIRWMPGLTFRGVKALPLILK